MRLRARTTFKPPRDRLPGPDPLPGIGDCSRLPQAEGELYDQCGDPVDAVPPAVDEDVVWLSVRDGRWQVARPSLVTYPVSDWRTDPGDVFDQPVSEGVRARPARPGHPGLECSGTPTRVTDPAGDASGPKGARDWVDVTAVELARSAASLCLAVTTRTPLRPLSGISVYYEQASLMKTADGRQVSQGGLPGAFGVRLNSRGRPEAFGGWDGPEGRYAELPEARVGGGGRTLTIEFPNARRLGLTRQPFAWMLTASVEVSPGRLASDRLPDARTRLFFAHPGGKRVVEAPDARARSSDARPTSDSVPAVKELAPGVWQLSGFPPNGINVFLLEDVLVDAASRHAGRRILRQLRGHTVTAHALTHAHPDHQGASKEVCEALGIPFWVGERDADAAENPDLIKQRQPDHPVARFYDRIFRGPGRRVDRMLREGDEVAGFKVLDTPGHSAGHVSYWRESDRVLVLGDVLNNMDVITAVPGLHEPKPFLTPDPAENRRSIRKLAALEPAARALRSRRPAAGTRISCGASWRSCPHDGGHRLRGRARAARAGLGARVRHESLRRVGGRHRRGHPHRRSRRAGLHLRRGQPDPRARGRRRRSWTVTEFEAPRRHGAPRNRPAAHRASST